MAHHNPREIHAKFGKMADKQTDVESKTTEEVDAPSSDPPTNDKDHDEGTPKKDGDSKAFDLGDLVW